MTLSTSNKGVKLRAILLSVPFSFCYAERHYAEWHYVECRCAERRGTVNVIKIFYIISPCLVALATTSKTAALK